MVLEILWYNFKAAPFTQSDPQVAPSRELKVNITSHARWENSSGSSHWMLSKCLWIQLKLLQPYLNKAERDEMTSPPMSLIYHILRSYISKRHSMNYYCALSHLMIIKFMVWNMKDHTAKLHCWYISLSCQTCSMKGGATLPVWIVSYVYTWFFLYSHWK